MLEKVEFMAMLMKITNKQSIIGIEKNSVEAILKI